MARFCRAKLDRTGEDARPHVIWEEGGRDSTDCLFFKLVQADYQQQHVKEN
jgi:hypothetical protein